MYLNDNTNRVFSLAAPTSSGKTFLMLQLAIEILKKYEGKARGNLHFFTGSSELAKKFIDLGYTISFPGVITFAKETEDNFLKLMHLQHKMNWQH